MLMTERQLRKVIRRVIKESIDPFSLGLPTTKPDEDPADYYDKHAAKLEKIANAYKNDDWSEVDPLGGHFRTMKPDESLEEYEKEASKEVKDAADNIRAYKKLANVILGDPNEKEKEAALKVFSMGAMPDPLLGGKGTMKPDGSYFSDDENPLSGSTTKPSENPSEKGGDLESRVETLEDHQEDIDKVIAKFQEKIK